MCRESKNAIGIKSRISRVLNRFLETKIVEICQGKLDHFPPQETFTRCLMLTARQNRTHNAKQLPRHIVFATACTALNKTAEQLLYHYGFDARQMMLDIPLPQDIMHANEVRLLNTGIRCPWTQIHKLFSPKSTVLI